MHINECLEKYYEELASGASTPGGGSASSACGALGASLISMVLNFTVGREKFKSVEEQAKKCLDDITVVRKALQKLIDEDTIVYGTVTSAYKLPKNTDEEKAKRSEEIQKALKIALKVPLEILKNCYKVLEISSEVIKIGNPQLISDVGVGVIMAETGLQGAYLNVEINLGGIKDAGLVSSVREEIKPLIENAVVLRNSLFEQVKKAIIRDGS